MRRFATIRAKCVGVFPEISDVIFRDVWRSNEARGAPKTSRYSRDFWGAVLGATISARIEKHHLINKVQDNIDGTHHHQMKKGHPKNRGGLFHLRWAELVPMVPAFSRVEAWLFIACRRFRDFSLQYMQHSCGCRGALQTHGSIPPITTKQGTLRLRRFLSGSHRDSGRHQRLNQAVEVFVVPGAVFEGHGGGDIEVGVLLNAQATS